MRRVILLLLCLLVVGSLEASQRRLRFVAASVEPGGDPDNPIDASRITDWSDTGATITDRDNSDSCTDYTSAQTVATVNAAIQACSSGVVYLNFAGTFTFTDTLVMKSNVTLRCQSPTATNLNFTGMGTGNNFYWGSGLVAVEFQGTESSPNEDNAPPMSSVPRASQSWSGTNGSAGTYTHGATTINLASALTGLAVGDTLVLWQSDEPDANLPMSGWFVSDKTATSPNGITKEGAGEITVGMQQRVRVTAVSGTTVTIADPGIVAPTGAWQTGLSPRAGYFDESAGEMIHDAGIEDCRIDTDSAAEYKAVIGINWAHNVWVKGVAFDPKDTSWHAGGAGDYVVYTIDSRNVSVINNWFDRANGGGLHNTTSYGVGLQTTHASRVENNIFNEVESTIYFLGGSSGNAALYNYERCVTDEAQECGSANHQPGPIMNLVEGNRFAKWWQDYFHGTSSFYTLYRNESDGIIDVASYNRWNNFVGNVITGGTAYKSLGNSAAHARSAAVCFRLGYAADGTGDANGVVDDSVVWTSTMLWGNYCTNGSSTRFVSAEVPTTDASWPNAEPATQDLPDSQIYSAIPAYFTINGVGTVTWPPIGPDVTGGDRISGHAFKTPAERMYDASSGSMANFDPTDYGGH